MPYIRERLGIGEVFNFAFLRWKFSNPHPIPQCPNPPKTHTDKGGVVSVKWYNFSVVLDRSQESLYPIPSMYGIFTYTYHTNQPNVGKYAKTLHQVGK